MTDDLVKRLRDMCGDDGILARRDVYDDDVAKAAERIEKLEAALLDLSEGWECCPVSQAIRRAARKALEGKDD
jgi:hypothetical protein